MEEDIENFLESENISTSRNTQDCTEFTPHLGMQFVKPEQAHRFFSNYAYMTGFAILITHQARTHSKKRNYEVVRITYACNRQGKQSNKKEGNTQEEEVDTERETRVLVKVGCKCAMVVCEREGVWTVTRLNLEHDHELSCTARYFRANKNLTEVEKKMVRTLNECNISTNKMMNILSYFRGGLDATPFRDKDLSNYRGKIKREAT